MCTYVAILVFPKTFEVEWDAIDEKLGSLDPNGSDSHRDTIHVTYGARCCSDLGQQRTGS